MLWFIRFLIIKLLNTLKHDFFPVMQQTILLSHLVSTKFNNIA